MDIIYGVIDLVIFTLNPPWDARSTDATVSSWGCGSWDLSLGLHY
jgi:hypothetical protein